MSGDDFLPQGGEAFGGGGVWGFELLGEEGDAEFFEHPTVGGEGSGVAGGGAGLHEGFVLVPEGEKVGGEAFDVGGGIEAGAVEAEADGFEVTGEFAEGGEGGEGDEAGVDEPGELVEEVVADFSGRGGGFEGAFEFGGVVEDAEEEGAGLGEEGAEGGTGGGKGGVEGGGVAGKGFVVGQEESGEDGAGEFFAKGGVGDFGGVEEVFGGKGKGGGLDDFFPVFAVGEDGEAEEAVAVFAGCHGGIGEGFDADGVAGVDKGGDEVDGPAGVAALDEGGKGVEGPGGVKMADG